MSWDGTAYSGWQWQANGHSIQAEVEGALERVLGQRAQRLVASGRTDAGVHALAQYVSFQTTVVRKQRSLLLGLNSTLPRDIAVLDVQPVPSGFNARTWATGKLYRYRILMRGPRCPLRERTTLHVPHLLDVEAMAEAVTHVVGQHDFTSFRASGCGSFHPVRTLTAARVFPVDDEVHIEFEGNGFLRHQVRILVGTLLDVGERRRPAEHLRTVLSMRDRRAAGRTALAKGLVLVRVDLRDRSPDEAAMEEFAEAQSDLG